MHINLVLVHLFFLTVYSCFAITLLFLRFGLSVRGAAKKHDIPEATLRHKLSGYHGMTSKPGPKTLLTNAEEQVLVNYVTSAVKRAHPVTKKNVLDAVKDILQDEERQGIARKLPPLISWSRTQTKMVVSFSKETPSADILHTRIINISKKEHQCWSD